MSGPYPPVEWVAGKSRIGWFAGFAGILCLVLIPYYFAEIWFFPSLLSTGNSFTGMLVDDLLLVPPVGLAAAFWVLLVPMPASRIGISPIGVTIDFGLRLETFPWDRVLPSRNTLVTLGKRRHLPTAHALTPYQSSRISAFLRRPS